MRAIEVNMGMMSVRKREEEREEERKQETKWREKRQGGHRRERGCGHDNGTEDIYNLEAGIYNPEVGRISTLNGHNLPFLCWLQLNAKFGRLQRVMFVNVEINLAIIISFLNI